MNESENYDELVGKRMICNAVSLDESLSEILKVEAKRLKIAAKKELQIEELQKINRIIKNVIMALTITEDKLKTGIELYLNSKSKNHT